jgi:hypothetical protein
MTWRSALVVALMLLAAGYVYAPVWQNGFVYEDANWQESYGPGTPAPAVTWNRPLMQWSWWWQAQQGEGPRAFHAVNLGLHLLATFLVWLLASRLGASPTASVLAASVFLLNALQVETVAYAANRPEEFAVIGVLTACLLVVGPLSVWRLGAALAAVCVGLAGKESAVVAVALLPLVRRQWRVAVAAGVGLAGLVWFEAAHRQYLGSPVLALTQTAAGFHLFGQAVIPQGLTVDAALELSAIGCLVSAALVVGGAVVAWRARWTTPLCAIGALWMLACLVPRLFVSTPASVLNAHQVYQAMPGFALMVAGWIDGAAIGYGRVI